MNNRLLLGRSLFMDNMRIVRRVAASFIKFLLMFLRELGALFPAYVIFLAIFYFGFFYAKYIHFLSLQVGALN